MGFIWWEGIPALKDWLPAAVSGALTVAGVVAAWVWGGRQKAKTEAQKVSQDGDAAILGSALTAFQTSQAGQLGLTKEYVALAKDMAAVQARLGTLEAQVNAQTVQITELKEQVQEEVTRRQETEAKNVTLEQRNAEQAVRIERQAARISVLERAVEVYQSGHMALMGAWQKASQKLTENGIAFDMDASLAISTIERADQFHHEFAAAEDGRKQS